MNARERRNMRRKPLQPVSPDIQAIFRAAASGRPATGTKGAVISWAVTGWRKPSK